MHIEVEYLRRLEPCVAYVVGIAYPGDCPARNAPTFLDKRKNIAKDLAGMIFIRQSVDDRYARMCSKATDDIVFISSNHDDIHHSGNHPGRIFHGFSAS